jgi:PAS domain S-box-containing protein
MQDDKKTKKQLIDELMYLRRCVEKLQDERTDEKAASEKLRDETGELENLIEEKTSELKRTHSALKAETSDRVLAHQLLRDRMELLEIIFSNIHFMIAYLNKEFDFVRVNDAYAKASGHGTEYFVGKNHFELYPNVENEAIFRNVLETAEPYHAFGRPFQYPNKPGRTTYWDWSVQAVRNVKGEVSGLILTLVDATDRKRAEEQASLYAKELERSNKELEDFAYVASHDLQEPLRKIRIFGDRLYNKYADSLDRGGRDYLERMVNAAKRGHNLIDALLTYSRVSTKAQHFTTVDLSEVVEASLSNLETRIEESNCRIEVAELPTIEGDPHQILQLLENLIGNALKFRKDGEPSWVRISARVFEVSGQDGGKEDIKPFHAEVCEIRVEDNGIGFDKKNIDRIFVPFQRLHGRSHYDGVGMGLTICRRIAERHGGTITAESTAGLGSTFIVTLPVKQNLLKKNQRMNHQH